MQENAWDRASLMHCTNDFSAFHTLIYSVFKLLILTRVVGWGDGNYPSDHRVKVVGTHVVRLYEGRSSVKQTSTQTKHLFEKSLHENKKITSYQKSWIKPLQHIFPAHHDHTSPWNAIIQILALDVCFNLWLSFISHALNALFMRHPLKGKTVLSLTLFILHSFLYSSRNLLLCGQSCQVHGQSCRRLDRLIRSFVLFLHSIGSFSVASLRRHLTSPSSEMEINWEI